MKNRKRISCTHCTSELIIGGDHSFDSYGLDGDGVVTNGECPNKDCWVSDVIIYIDLNEINEE